MCAWHEGDTLLLEIKAGHARKVHLQTPTACALSVLSWQSFFFASFINLFLILSLGTVLDRASNGKESIDIYMRLMREIEEVL